MEDISKISPFNKSKPVLVPTRYETVVKFKDRVTKLNISLISDDSFTDSFDDQVSVSDNGTQCTVKLDIQKCFVMRKSSPGDGFVEEVPDTSTSLSEEISHPISDCESSSSLESSIVSSKKTRKPISTKKSFICNICKRGFVFKKRYQDHILTHSISKDTITISKKKKDSEKVPETSFDCEYCFKTYPTKAKFKKHVKRVHLAKNMYTCDQCPKFFWTWSGLRDHRVTRHVTELGLSCEVCGKTYAAKKKLAIHMKSHPNHDDLLGGLKT